MRWKVLVFMKRGHNRLVAAHTLPDTFSDADAIAWVGDYPNLRYDSFPIPDGVLDEMAKLLSIEVDRKFEYFLEYEW